MPNTFHIRPAALQDLAAVTQLFERSYPELLCPDYTVQTLRDALPVITTAQVGLLQGGTYYLAECTTSGAVVGAGGWTDLSPVRGVVGTQEGHVRHVATDPDRLRQGIARALIAATLNSARAHGMMRLHCMSTLTARRFYGAMGFSEKGEIELRLAPGVYFPAVQMMRELC